MDAWATAADLAQAYGVSYRTIMRWASEDNWRPTMARPRKYRISDADASYRKRHGGRARALLARRLTR